VKNTHKTEHPLAGFMPSLATLVVAIALLVATGCAGRTQEPFGPDRLIPADQSRLTFTPEVAEPQRELLMQAARALSCQHPLGCTCFLDGIQTSCAFVFSCLDAGSCTCVSGCANVGD